MWRRRKNEGRTVAGCRVWSGRHKRPTGGISEHHHMYDSSYLKSTTCEVSVYYLLLNIHTSVVRYRRPNLSFC